MSRRLSSLAAVLLAALAAGACADHASPTQPSGPGPSHHAQRMSQDDPATCRSGWNSSTGRCQ